jgi:broad specificity phosphatase PhoE
MTKIVWIARHANRLDFLYPEWFNTAERRYDPPLSPDGVIQAQALAQRLKREKIAHIFSSPFLRAIQTAKEVATVLELPIKIERGLGEWLNPEWMTEMPETHPQELLREEYPHIDWNYASRVIPFYPETEGQMFDRSAETARELLKDFQGNLLFVCHGASVLGATKGLVGGNPAVRTPLCCLVKLSLGNGQWQIELNGDTSHLVPNQSSREESLSR